MSSPLRTVRTMTATLLAAGMLQLAAIVASPPADANQKVATATTWVNIRSGPGTSYSKLGILYEGQSVEVTGQRGNWAVVRYNGSTAYIYSSYLSIRSSSASQVSAGGRKGSVHSTARLNVRTAPSLASQVITTVNPHTAFTLTGRTSNGFSEVTYRGATRWVWSAYISAPSSPGKPSAPAPSLPKVTGKMRLTGRLMIRSDDTPNFTSLGKLPIGSIIDVTGVKRNGVVQAVYQGAVRWFDADWVVPVDSGPAAPKAPAAPSTIGSRYSKHNLNVRAAASHSSALLGVASAGTTLQVTGRISNGYAEINWHGRTAWVAGQYLIASTDSLITAWSAGLDSLLPNGKRIVRTVHSEFPQIKVMYGVRFDPIPDHPSGKAVDIMIPNYKNNKELGWRIAEYMKANAKRLKIRYIIFDQKLWNIERDSAGWRRMSDRGGDTANHKDHVHITTY
ncbi:MAG: SH3 domain-containing protein [Propionibacteriaceae bacterium]|nr:SH3 domain-containing protein [Propionibacteriaceae bacterium]